MQSSNVHSELLMTYIRQTLSQKENVKDFTIKPVCYTLMNDASVNTVKTVNSDSIISFNIEWPGTGTAKELKTDLKNNILFVYDVRGWFNSYNSFVYIKEFGGQGREVKYSYESNTVMVPTGMPDEYTIESGLISYFEKEIRIGGEFAQVKNAKINIFGVLVTPKT